MEWFHFQIGWLNVWILALVFNVAPAPILMSIGDGSKSLKRQTAPPPMSRVERAVYYLLFMSPPFVMFFYTIFVPFTTNAALLCAGLVLFVVGLALYLKQVWDYATAPPDELITHGIFRISRNPGYFGQTLVYLGMGLAGGSWLVVAFAVYWFISYQWSATLEERFCAKHWAEEFAEYKRKVAKNFLFF